MKPMNKRPKPSQVRSHQRVQSILDSAKLLLIDEGYEEMSIQKLSRKAKVTAPSIYRYFPNKRAIIATFADTFLETQTKAIHFCLEKSLRGMHWEDVLHTFMSLLSESVRQEKWLSPAQLAIRSDRGLREVHENLLDNIADQFTLLFRSFGCKQSDDDLFTLCRMLVLLLDAFMLSLDRITEDAYPLAIESFKEVIVSHFRNHIP